MIKRVAEAVLERANGRCEHCGKPFGGSLEDKVELDHFFSKARAPESVENVWALRGFCHRLKTDSFPSSATWLMHFILHGRKHGYLEAVERAQKRLEFVNARTELGT